MEPRPTKVQLLAALERLERREKAAIAAAVLPQGSRTPLPRPYVRQQLRTWFGLRKDEINKLWRGWE